MVAQPQTTFISAEAFQQLLNEGAYEDTSIELINGELVTMPLPGFLHGRLTYRISNAIAKHADAHDLGELLAAETGFILKRNPDGRDTVRGVDVSFLRAERLPDTTPEGFVNLYPDLAVEVISPSNTAEDIQEKVLQLLEAGTPLIWIVYPKTQTVIVHQAGGAVTLTTADTLTGDPVLPGFRLPVAQIFAGL